jgi:hypothetical protein
MKRNIAFLLYLAVAAPAFAQPGVVNGVLVDPHAYVGSLIDFGQVVPDALMPGELARIRPALNACDIHIQNEVRGDMKARLFLPPSAFEHVVDIWDFGGSKAWVWVDRGGPFMPTACNFGQPEPQPIPAPTPQPTPQPVPTPVPPLVIDADKIAAAIDRNTAELAGIRQDVKTSVGDVLAFFGKYIVPPIAAAVATWQVAK